MAIPGQILNIPLVGGLTQKNGDVILEAPSFAQLDNARFDKTGAIYQRHGFGKLPDPNDAFAPRFLATNGAALVGRGFFNVASYQADRALWTESAPMTPGGVVHPTTAADVYVRDIPGNVSGIEHYDFARNSDAGTPECTVVSTGGPAIVASIRAADGTEILGPRELTGGSATALKNVRVVSLGTVFYVVATDATLGCFGWSCDTAISPVAWSAGVAVDASAVGVIDIEPNALDGELVAAYWNGTNVIISRISTALAVVASVTTSHATTPTFLTLRYASGSVIATYASSAGDFSGCSYSADLLTTHFASQSLGTLAGFAVVAGDAVPFGGAWLTVWTEISATGAYALRTSNVSSSGAVGTAATSYHVAQVAKAQTTGFNIMIPAQCTLSLSNLAGMLLQNYNTAGGMRFACIARFAVDRSYASGVCHSTISVQQTDFSVRFAVGSYQGTSRGTGGAAALRSRLCSVLIDMIPGGGRYVEYDGVTYWGGGLLVAYDGQVAQECSPQWDPFIFSATASSGGVLAAGTYSWKAVYEWEDARGVLHRSAPSPLVTKTLTAGQSCTLTVAKLDVTARDGATSGGVRVALYRTTLGGSVFYLVTPSADLTASSLAGYWDILDDTVTDANLGQVLYTEGGFLPAGRLPPVWDLCLGGGRMWIISADRRSEVWFSKPLERTIAPEFDVSQVIDPGCGELMAIARMDDKTVVFSREQIFVIFGDGPNAAGVGGAFSQPQPIASDTGCLSRGSVCEGPFGVVFHGKRGLCLLTRGLEVVPIGDDVVDLVTADSVVTSAVLAPESDEVRFTLATGGTVVWSYTTSQWGRWTGLGTQLHAAAWGDKYIVADGTYAVREYNPAKYGDDYGGVAAGDELVARTGWIRVAGIHGFQRVRRIYVTYTKNGTCGIAIKARFNNNATTVTLRTVAAADLAASGELCVHVPTQQCEGIQVQVESVGAADGVGTLTIQALSLEIAAKTGGGRYAATARR